MTQNTLIVGILLAILLGAIGWFVWTGKVSIPGGEIACTMEAKLCPDGSAVGRTGPNCEFAECPPSSGKKEIQAVGKIGETFSGLGVSLTPLSVVEDSRCPLDVVCIQAGTVRVKVRVASGLGTSDMTLTLGTPITTEAEEVTLLSVSPAPYSTVTIPPNSYVFTFLIKKR